MTNRERLNQLDNNAFMNKLKELSSGVRYEYIDWDKYLNADEEELDERYIKGVPGEYQNVSTAYAEMIDTTPEKRKCIILEAEEYLEGKDFIRVYDTVSTHIYSVPNSRILLF